MTQELPVAAQHKTSLATAKRCRILPVEELSALRSSEGREILCLLTINLCSDARTKMTKLEQFFSPTGLNRLKKLRRAGVKYDGLGSARARPAKRPHRTYRGANTARSAAESEAGIMLKTSLSIL